MKAMILALGLFSSVALAKPGAPTPGLGPAGEELYSIESEKKAQMGDSGSNNPKGINTPSRVGSGRRSPDGVGGSHPGGRGYATSGNLPAEFRSRSMARLETTTSQTILPSKDLKEHLKILKVGMQVLATIEHSIIAFPDEKAPVIATVDSGSLKGLKLIGESRLERNSKRVFIEFTTASTNGKAFKFKGSGLNNQGQTGFEGEYHSQEVSLFSGEFLASLVAAYFDGLVPRSTNVFGQAQADTSVDSAFKRGLAGGAMATAERFKEKMKRVPEFSEVQGPIEVKVLVLEKALEM